MRYYIVDILETLGEYEFSSTILVNCEKGERLHSKLNNICASFRNAPDIETSYSPPTEVSEAEFEFLKHFITEL